MSDNFRIALVSAAAAIIGALTGGGATYLATSASERAADHRADRQTDDRVRGAARYLVSEFARATAHAALMRQEGLVLDLGRALRILIPSRDLQLVLSRLTPDQTTLILGGLAADVALDLLIKEQPNESRLGSTGKQLVTFAQEAMQDAMDALRPSADIGRSDPPLRLTVPSAP